MTKLRRIDLIFLAGLTLTPFFFWPTALIPYEVPKVWLIAGYVMLLAVFSLFQGTEQKKSNTQKVYQPLLLAVVSYFAIAFLASILGANIAKSILGNPYRVDGLITLSLLIAFAILAKDRLTKQMQFPLMLCLWLSSTILSLWATSTFLLLHTFGQSVPNWYGAIGLHFGQPNFLAGYLLVTLPTTYYLITNSWMKPLVVSLFLIQCFAIGSTYSWGAVAGIVLFLLLILTRKYFSYWHTIWIALLVLFIALFTSISFYKTNTSFVAESRPRIYTRVSEAFLQRPLTGWGVANVDYAFKSTAQKDNFVHDIYLDKAHSEFLEVATTTGIFGFMTYSIILTLLWKSISKRTKGDHKWKTTLLMMLVLYLFHSQTNVLSISEHLIFWLIIGDTLRDNKD